MQINIVDAGTAVKHAVINDKAFKVQNAERFAGIDGHAVNRDVYARVLFGSTTIPIRVGVRGRSTNTPTLCAVPVNQYPNIKLRTLTLGIVQGLQNRLSGIVLFEI